MKTQIQMYRLLLVLIIACAGSIGSAQVSPSVYFMDHLPSANALNPAFYPPNNFNMNLPLISSTYLSAELPFSYAHFTRKNSAEDRVYIDKQGIVDAMDEVGTASIDLNTELLRAGFKAGRHYINLSLSKVFSTDISLERDLVEFLLFGNGSDAFLGKQLSFSKTGFKSTFYHEFALGWSTRINDKFSAGLRVKYLNGVLNAWSEKADLNVRTDPDNNYALSASTDLLIHTSAAFGYLDDIDFEDPMDYLLVRFTNNHGFAGDIGLSYKPVEKLQLSASAIDLGMITWKDHVKSYRSKYPGEPYTFEGFDMDELLNGGSIADSIDVLDSLDEHFSIETISESYTSYLTPKAYFGVAYDLTRHDQVGLLIKGKFPENNLLMAYTLNYRRTFGDVFAAFVNYTFKKNVNHFGFGLSLRAGPLVFYAMNDMIDTLFEPTKAKGYNVQFGITLAFGKPYRDEQSDKLPAPPPEEYSPQDTGDDTTN